MTAAAIDLDLGRAELARLVALASLDGIGPATLRACLVGCGPISAWDAVRSGHGRRAEPIASAIAHLRRREPEVEARLGRDASAIDPDALLDQHEAAGQQVAAHGASGYPARLLDDLAPPAVVFWQGSLASLDRPTVAIVGTRNATRLGCETAGRLAVELADHGVSVVSGLALGIDGAAHRAVVQHPGGAAVGVIATGLERAYPRQHRGLHRQVAESGLLLSESPIGSKPVRWRFPARNRIIAALADAVVVVESRSAGGSMLTADQAVARDRTVLAVPGHPTSLAAAGTLDLIADGAVPVRDVTDVLVAIGLGGLEPAGSPPPRRTDPVAPSPLAGRLLDLLDPNPSTLGELVLASAASLEEVSSALVELEQSGLTTRSGAWFERSGSAVRRPRARPGQ